MTPPEIDQLARSVLAPVADAAVRALALACLIGIAIVFFRSARAAVRLSVWTVVLYGALALPVLGLVVPAWQWRVPTINALQGWWPAPATAMVPVTSASSAISTPLAAGHAAAPVSTTWSTIAIAAVIYLAGVLVLLIHAGIAWIATRRLRLSARAIVDPDALVRLGRQASTARMSKPPRLVESAELFVPVTMSVTQPVILLPVDWRNWPAEKLDAVLAHEVAHVARRDALTQSVALFYRAVLWCSPLSWWLHRRLSDLAEQASDEAALEAGIDPATYANALVDFFARLQQGPRRADWHVAMARRADADAAQRVERILSWKGGPIMTRSTLKWLVVGIALAAVPVVVVTASVQLTPQIPEPRVVLAFHEVAPAAAPEVPVELARPVPARQNPASTAVVRSRKPAAARDLRQQQTPPPPTPPPAPPPPTPAPPAGSETPDDDFAKGAYPAATPGLLQPKAVILVKPRYTPDAMRQKIQGMVIVEIIVLPDGTVGKARIKESLDKEYGLDESALETARKWTFTPATLNGQPVAVLTTVSLMFQLH